MSQINVGLRWALSSCIEMKTKASALQIELVVGKGSKEGPYEIGSRLFSWTGNTKYLVKPPPTSSIQEGTFLILQTGPGDDRCATSYLLLACVDPERASSGQVYERSYLKFHIASLGKMTNTVLERWIFIEIIIFPSRQNETKVPYIKSQHQAKRGNRRIAQ